jgi:YidC/Oxa1 family membrane protein insertase
VIPQVTDAVHLLEPLYEAVTFVMMAFHTLFKNIGFNPAGGWAWGLSIVGLVVVIRTLLIPLFVKQINAQRGLQILQPEIKKIQAKYKGKSDPETRQKQSQEMMKLYKDTGTNPLSSCLPILAQAPIFFALFHVLNGIGKEPPKGKGFLTDELAAQAADASILGASISEKFIGADSLHVQIVCAVLIVLMSASTFITQKQLMTKNMPAGSMDGNPFMQQQKILLYVFPLIFAVSGINFPIGVLLYWLTTNIWSMGQQFYVIRRMPAPGSAAEEALARRRAAKKKPDDPPPGGPTGSPGSGGPGSGGSPSPNGAGPTGSSPNGEAGAPASPPTSRQRQQPKRQPKRKR